MKYCFKNTNIFTTVNKWFVFYLASLLPIFHTREKWWIQYPVIDLHFCPNSAPDSAWSGTWRRHSEPTCTWPGTWSNDSSSRSLTCVGLSTSQHTSPMGPSSGKSPPTKPSTLRHCTRMAKNWSVSLSTHHALATRRRFPCSSMAMVLGKASTCLCTSNFCRGSTTTSWNGLSGCRSHSHCTTSTVRQTCGQTWWRALCQTPPGSTSRSLWRKWSLWALGIPSLSHTTFSKQETTSVMIPSSSESAWTRRDLFCRERESDCTRVQKWSSFTLQETECDSELCQEIYQPCSHKMVTQCAANSHKQNKGSRTLKTDMPALMWHVIVSHLWRS